MESPVIPRRKDKQKHGFLSFIKGSKQSPAAADTYQSTLPGSKPALPDLDDFSAEDLGNFLVDRQKHGLASKTPKPNGTTSARQSTKEVDTLSEPNPSPRSYNYRTRTPDRAIAVNAKISELSNARARQLSQKVNFARGSSESLSNRHIARQDASFERDDAPALPSAMRTDSPARTPSTKSGERRKQRVGNATQMQDEFNFSLPALPPLQIQSQEAKPDPQLTPIREDDPNSYELGRPQPNQNGVQVAEHILEERANLMHSREHLAVILEDPTLLNLFSQFLAARRSSRMATFNYYLDALKAVRGIQYVNSIARDLDSRKIMIAEPMSSIASQALHQRLDKSFESMLDQDLPAFVAHQWTKIVSASARYRITGTMPDHLRNASDGLAEVFCLTDPRQDENPIVFCSQEFARTTQYGLGYAIGRNCRFLQGHGTSAAAIRRISNACRESRDHTEVFLNYRRDGSPFMNMLMLSPLFDADGELKYFFGAQVDVSGLLLASAQLEGLARLLNPMHTKPDPKTEFQTLAELFNTTELTTIRKHGGKLQQQIASNNSAIKTPNGGRVVLTDPMGADSVLDDSSDAHESESVSKFSMRSDRTKSQGRLPGVYEHYLLIRPAPSLRILFTSPSLQSPSLLQASFLDCIGGSATVRDELARILQEGRGVTAKVRWNAKPRPGSVTVDPFYSVAVEGHDAESESGGHSTKDYTWIHCTPLLDSSRKVGVWVVILVKDDVVT